MSRPMRKSTDQSNFNRTGTLEVAGVGGEYAYTTDVPPVRRALGHAIAQPQRGRHRRRAPAPDARGHGSELQRRRLVLLRVGEALDAATPRISSSTSAAATATARRRNCELFFPANSDTLRLAKMGLGRAGEGNRRPESAHRRVASHHADLRPHRHERRHLRALRRWLRLRHRGLRGDEREPDRVAHGRRAQQHHARASIAGSTESSTTCCSRAGSTAARRSGASRTSARGTTTG